jgi:serine/threonine protein kinase
MPLATGTRLGPYEILAPIGAGGMGEVYRARDTRLDRTVAIKVLPAHLSRNPQLRERFEREAKAVSSLSHPHICPLYDVGQQDGIDYLVMEHLEGETLAGRLKKGPLPPDQVLQYGIQITDALDTAHKHGVIHRDLKPGNIMLTKSGAKLLDFGLAKVRAAEAVAGMTAAPTQTRSGGQQSGPQTLAGAQHAGGSFPHCVDKIIIRRVAKRTKMLRAIDPVSSCGFRQPGFNEEGTGIRTRIRFGANRGEDRALFHHLGKVAFFLGRGANTVDKGQDRGMHIKC